MLIQKGNCENEINKLRGWIAAEQREKKKMMSRVQHDDQIFIGFMDALLSNQTAEWQEICKLVEFKSSTHVTYLRNEQMQYTKQKEFYGKALEKRNQASQDRVRLQREHLQAVEKLDQLERLIPKATITQAMFFREAHLKISDEKKSD